LPNVFLPILGGYLIDKLGSRQMIFIFSCLVFCGSILFASGVGLKSFPLMILGRIIGGLGGESLEVAGTTITTEWFQYVGYLSLALGLNLSASRVATAAQDSISPWIVQWIESSNPDAPLRQGGPAAAAWFGSFICAISLVSGLVLIRIDTPQNRMDAGITAEGKTMEEEDRLPLLQGAEDADEDSMDFSEQSTNITIVGDFSSPSEQIHPKESSTLAWLKKLKENTAFWILCITTVSLYGSIMPFIHVSSDCTVSYFNALGFILIFMLQAVSLWVP
jgi:MFS family permease